MGQLGRVKRRIEVIDYADTSGVKDLLKVSYDAPGFPLDGDIYPDGLRADQKRSVFDSIVARERRRSRSRLEMFKKHPCFEQLRRKVREIIARERWTGVLSEFKDQRRHYYLNCGRYVIEEQDESGETRRTVTHCNDRRYCPDDAERYCRGKALEVSKEIEALVQATGATVRKFRHSMPDFIRDQITDEEKAAAISRAFAEIDQEFYGCHKNTRTGSYDDGSVYLISQTHYYSSSEGWRSEVHFHNTVIPVRVKGQEFEVVDRRIGKKDLQWFRRRSAEKLREVARELGLDRIEDIPDELVVNLSYINPKDPRVKARPLLYRYGLDYDMRSPAFDLEDAVQRVDLESGVLLLSFSRFVNECWYMYPAVWPLSEYAIELVKRLKLKRTNTRYGWARRFKSKAPVLGIGVSEDEGDSFKPVKDLTVTLEAKRQYERKWNNKGRRFETVKRMYVRKLPKFGEAPDSWQEVDPWTIRGEQIWVARRRTYSSLDRGG